MTTMMERSFKYLDERLGSASLARTALRKVFPDHWSFLLGEIALFALVVLIFTGTFLTFFYNPSIQEVVYDGPYEPLRGAHVSAAYNSVLRLSFEVPAGLLMRQTHHWAALVFLAAIVIHLCRIFFTGAFRRPREVNWLVGVLLLFLALGEGFTGYSLPDDLLSGTGVRAADGFLKATPVLGSYM
ncbi:MAG: cytochrome b, partial [Acidimicrobiia bacterium]